MINIYTWNGNILFPVMKDILQQKAEILFHTRGNKEESPAASAQHVTGKSWPSSKQD